MAPVAVYLAIASECEPFPDGQEACTIYKEIERSIEREIEREGDRDRMILINFSIHKALELCKQKGHAFHSDGHHLSRDGIEHMCGAFKKLVLDTDGPYGNALVPLSRFYGLGFMVYGLLFIF